MCLLSTFISGDLYLMTNSPSASWAIDPGSTSAPNMTVFHAKWAPWVPRLRKFIGGKTDDIVEAGGLPRSSCAASDAIARMHLDRCEVYGSSV